MGDAARWAALRVAGCLAWLTVVVEITYPLAHGSARSAVTVIAVGLFFLASMTHAAATRGVAWASGFFAVAAGGGMLAEVVGVATGLPFGAYAYSDSLGAKLLGVPLVIPLAWAMMAYPAFVVAGRLTSRRLLHGLLTGTVKQGLPA